MELEQAQQLGNELRAALSPYCVRIEIAGSTRRFKPDPKDLEIVAIPETGTFQIADLWGESQTVVMVNRLEDALSEYLTSDGPWVLDDQLRRAGPNYKRLRHKALDVACDLFITDARKWAYTFTIRTGPGDFSTALVKRAHYLRMFFDGCLLHKHPPMFFDGRTVPCPIGARCSQVVELTEEMDLFAALKMPYIPPERRGEVSPQTVLDISVEGGQRLDAFSARMA